MPAELHTPNPEDKEKLQDKLKSAIGDKSSKGENLFDWTVYGGIQGLGTFLIGIPITYWAKYGKGAQMFENAGKTLEKTGMNAHTAEQVLMTTALMMGGNIMLLPVKAAENRKVEIVQKLNKRLGDKTDISTVTCEPPQTWSSLVKSRLLAWGLVFASFHGASHAFGKEKFAKFENMFSEHIVCKPLGMATHDVLGAETKAFRVGKVAALDVFATAAATVLLYVTSRIFAKEEQHGKTRGSEACAPQKAKDATEAPPAKENRVFTQAITPQSGEIKVKPKKDSFSETVVAQKESGPALSV